MLGLFFGEFMSDVKIGFLSATNNASNQRVLVK